MKTNVFIRKLAGMLCLLFLFSVPVLGVDSDPPYMVNPVPEPDTIVGPSFTIKVGVVDDGLGVNESTIHMWVNNAPVEPIIEPSYGGLGFRLYHTVVGSFDNAITVRVEAQDIVPWPDTPNLMVDSWQFAVASMGFNERLQPIYPPDGAWLDFERENHEVCFIWSKGHHSDFYRFKLLMGQSEYTFDVNPASYTYDDDFGIVSIRYELNSDQWKVLNDLGEFDWQIAPIESMGGELILDYTFPQTIRYKSGIYATPDKPAFGARIEAKNPPKFAWDPLDGQIEGYYFVSVRMDGDQYTTDAKLEFIPYFINEYRMPLSQWKNYSAGNYQWTIFGVYPGGLFSDFLVYEFNKLGTE